MLLHNISYTANKPRGSNRSHPDFRSCSRLFPLILACSPTLQKIKLYLLKFSCDQYIYIACYFAFCILNNTIATGFFCLFLTQAGSNQVKMDDKLIPA
jgi:hypothetical protein